MMMKVLTLPLLVMLVTACGGNKYLLERDQYRSSQDPAALAVPPGLDRGGFGDSMKIPAAVEMDELVVDAPLAKAWLSIAGAAERSGLMVERFDRQGGLLAVKQGAVSHMLMLQADGEKTRVRVQGAEQSIRDALLKQLSQQLN